MARTTELLLNGFAGGDNFLLRLGSGKRGKNLMRTGV